MKVTETFLKGCFVIEPTVFGDKRGSFFEVFNQKVFEEKIGLKINFVQDNQSTSQKGVLRGLHLQKGEYAQAKLVRVIQGKVLDVAVDVRKDSPTFGKHFSIELSGDNNKQLLVPRGFLHGFATLEDNTIFAYKCDNYYHKDSEYGIIYNDPTLKIDWKLEESEIILSEKDKLLQNVNIAINN
ncbi:dTDP-4-dehydrorhamnose 3,5-epimerase [Polaribacter sp. MSW13]|uniref:dTDP-4-dehydrorhamnose 3,5-epimerase n=1 Tax=Polaribacter marinus TaxID=2916838 RepID=A0A9X2AKV3_9FLAO|nr:dTDP-4-dehydrorhamnose 3,5-epimerase [Polaribacter marinus]MCI2228615.1 dTDP-4-dehydrorhamnose 3,5-epimerase [Polaribacter marinus]